MQCALADLDCGLDGTVGGRIEEAGASTGPLAGQRVVVLKRVSSTLPTAKAMADEAGANLRNRSGRTKVRSSRGAAAHML